MRLLSLALVTALVGCATAQGAALAPAAVPPAAAVPQAAPAGPGTHVAAPDRVAWVGASVATVWRRTTDVRPVDRIALSAHPDVSAWLRAQTVAQQRGLDVGVMTQAVRGELVHVLARRGAWSQVRVDDQRGSAYPLGIIGWVPSVQLRWSAPDRPAYDRTVGHPSGAAAVATARGFLGVPYLWAGMTHSGIDCSGLVYVVFRELGMTLPRDAADQATAGRSVTRLEPGDLVFFGRGGRDTIHHVGIYVGGGRVLHAPGAGRRVTVSRLSTWSDFWGARRLVPTR